MNTELRRQLLEMVEEDQRVRAELAATGELFEGYAPKMAEVHRRHAQELETMIEQYGWPGKSLVGEDGLMPPGSFCSMPLAIQNFSVDACLLCRKR